MVYPSIDPRLGEYTFDEIVIHVRNYMRYYINEKFLRGDITTNAATQRNPFIRVVPLFIKDFTVRLFYTKVQDRNSSAGLTNMGALKVPEDMKPYIERFDIYMGQPFSSRTNCAIASFEDTLTINFASSPIIRIDHKLPVKTNRFKSAHPIAAAERTMVTRMPKSFLFTVSTWPFSAG